MWWKRLTLEQKSIFVFLGVIGIFAVSRFYPLLQGATFASTELENGSTLHGETFSLSGTTKNTKELYINDNPIPIDQKGNWKTALGLPPGYAILTVEAFDRFGASHKKTYQFVVEAEKNIPSVGVNTENSLENTQVLDTSVLGESRNTIH